MKMHFPLLLPPLLQQLPLLLQLLLLLLLPLLLLQLLLVLMVVLLLLLLVPPLTVTGVLVWGFNAQHWALCGSNALNYGTYMVNRIAIVRKEDDLPS